MSWSGWPLTGRFGPGLTSCPPAGDWTTWLVLGGRGAGKTRTGAEWIRALVEGRPPFASRPYGRIALVGETLGDVRDVMIEGVSGLLAIHPKGERPRLAALAPPSQLAQWRRGPDFLGRRPRKPAWAAI